ncbi:hypothetical protein [Faunimonas pinastri]|nr:hypothetical protein [Faunimonas pinastri]
MTRNKPNPVHVFERDGASKLNSEHLARENDRLGRENADLRRRLKAAQERLRFVGDPPPEEDRLRFH